MPRTLILSTATLAAALLASACGKPADPAQDLTQSTAPNTTAGQPPSAQTLSANLQSCSYDGTPVTAEPTTLTGNPPSECSTAVQKIMGFTGLPANFLVVAGPVPNAAAVIMMDNNKIPRRVIAFNPDFMSSSEARVGGSVWGPMSIMAHEIAHHLSGHTIVPGGSRPEIELEADKFSGFVLYRMGAPLAAATQMILAVGTAHGSPTHPDKNSRAQAIRQGWIESCQQGGGTACDSGTTQPPATMTPAPAPSAGPPPQRPVTPQRPVARAAQILPTPGSIPFKYGHFIIDETGKLDPARSRAIEQKLFTLAKNAGVEFTILVVNDLRGMTAENYAWAMMRQLRVGKLDVGNGAVVVVAPKQRQAAVAFGPGLAKEAEFSNPDKQLLSWIDNAWGYCNDADGCQGWTDALFGIFDGTLFWAARSKWTVDSRTLGPLLKHYDAMYEQRMRTKRAYDPAIDQANGALLRISGRITSLTPPTGIGQVNARIIGGKLGYTAVSMTTDEGYPVIFYVSPRLAPLMPSGKLRAGARYTTVGRLQSTGDLKKTQASALWLFSYDPL